MAEYTDFQLEQGDYTKAKELYNENAIILSIRNLLLSKPGNFPFNPSIGIDIQKYQFDILDNQTLTEIESELNRQISLYIPEMVGIDVQIRKVIDKNTETAFLGIAISSNINGEDANINFIIGNDGDIVKVFNEIN